MNHAHAPEVKNGMDSNDGLQVILMLYDGAINFLNKAVAFGEGGKDAQKKNLYTRKANDIIIGLDNVLDAKADEGFTRNMRLLYSFMNRQLVEAMVTGKSKGLADVMRMLTELRDSWQHLDSSRRASAAA